MKSANIPKKISPSLAKSFATFEGSFMALEYLLSKGQDASATALFSEMFSPNDILGQEKLVKMSPEEQYEFFETHGYFPYLDNAKVSAINQLLEKVTEAHIHANYNAEELNDKGIYPGAWHDDNSPDQAFNERQLREDLAALKKIFHQAAADKDYLVVTAG